MREKLFFEYDTGREAVGFLFSTTAKEFPIFYVLLSFLCHVLTLSETNCTALPSSPRICPDSILKCPKQTKIFKLTRVKWCC